MACETHTAVGTGGLAQAQRRCEIKSGLATKRSNHGGMMWMMIHIGDEVTVFWSKSTFNGKSSGPTLWRFEYRNIPEKKILCVRQLYSANHFSCTTWILSISSSELNCSPRWFGPWVDCGHELSRIFPCIIKIVARKTPNCRYDSSNVWCGGSGVFTVPEMSNILQNCGSKATRTMDLTWPAKQIYYWWVLYNVKYSMLSQQSWLTPFLLLKTENLRSYSRNIVTCCGVLHSSFSIGCRTVSSQLLRHLD